MSGGGSRRATGCQINKPWVDGKGAPASDETTTGPGRARMLCTNAAVLAERSMGNRTIVRGMSTNLKAQGRQGSLVRRLDV